MLQEQAQSGMCLPAKSVPARRGWIVLLFVIAATAAVYSQALRFPFVAIDDPIFVSRNPYVADGLSLKTIRWSFCDSHCSNWIPLTWLSLMLDTELFGLRASGFHATNIALHLANVILIYVCFARATGSAYRSAFVAALFALHPLHVESVAWISERKDVLSIFFGLLSIYAYIRYSQHRDVRWYLMTAGMFLCSMMAKQTLVTLPCVLLLMDYWPLCRTTFPQNGFFMPASEHAVRAPLNPPARLVLEKLPLFAISALFCAVVIGAQARDHSIQSFAELPLPARALNATVSYGIYLRKLLAPVDLAVFYPHPETSLSLVGAAASSLVLGVITILAVTNRTRQPFFLVGWLWFLGTLVPMIGLIQVGWQQLADRYAYFPLIGIYVSVAWTISAWVEKYRRLAPIVPAAAVIVAAALAIATYFQVGRWKDGETLMRHSLAVADDNPFSRAVLADALLDQGRVDEALEELHNGIKLAPDDPVTYFRLGLVLEFLHRYEDALMQYRLTLALEEANAGAHLRSGLVLIQLRRYREAQKEIARSLEIDDQNANAFGHLASLCRELGDYKRSLECCQRAIELDDSLVVCHHLMALNLRDLGRLDEADDPLRVVLAADPENRQARSDLRRILAMTAAAVR